MVHTAHWAEVLLLLYKTGQCSVSVDVVWSVSWSVSLSAQLSVNCAVCTEQCTVCSVHCIVFVCRLSVSTGRCFVQSGCKVDDFFWLWESNCVCETKLLQKCFYVFSSSSLLARHSQDYICESDSECWSHLHSVCNLPLPLRLIDTSCHKFFIDTLC